MQKKFKNVSEKMIILSNMIRNSIIRMIYLISLGKKWQKTQAHFYDEVFTATVSKFRTLSLIILNLAVKLILMVDKIKDSLIIIMTPQQV